MHRVLKIFHATSLFHAMFIYPYCPTDVVPFECILLHPLMVQKRLEQIMLCNNYVENCKCENLCKGENSQREVLHIK